MARPNTSDTRRDHLLPEVARYFARTGYSRAKTADLASHCGVPENTLFRLWGGKKAMYLAALGYIYERTVAVWQAHLASAGGERTAAELLLEHEGRHYGEHGLYRVIFTGLSEIDDPDIRKALRQMYRRFSVFVQAQIAAHRGSDSGADLLAWALMGMATIAGIGRELRLVSPEQQRALFATVGRALLDLAPPDAVARSLPVRGSSRRKPS